MTFTSAIKFATVKNTAGQSVQVPIPPVKPKNSAISAQPITHSFQGTVTALPTTVLPSLAAAQEIASQVIQKHTPPNTAASPAAAQLRLEDGLLEKHANITDLNHILSAAVGEGRIEVLDGPKPYRLVNHIIGAMNNSAIVESALARLSGVRIKTETDIVFGRMTPLQPLKKETNWLHAVKITDGGDIAIHADLADPQAHPDPRVLQAAIAAGLVYKATEDAALANRAAMDIAHKQGNVRLGVLPMAYAKSDWLNGVNGRRNGWLSYLDSHATTAQLMPTNRTQMGAAAAYLAELTKLEHAGKIADENYWASRPTGLPPAQ